MYYNTFEVISIISQISSAGIFFQNETIKVKPFCNWSYVGIKISKCSIIANETTLHQRPNVAEVKKIDAYSKVRYFQIEGRIDE